LPLSTPSSLQSTTLPLSTPSSLHSAPITPAMSQYATSSPCRTLLGYNSQSLMPMVSSPHSMLQNLHQPAFMSPNAPEFVPTMDSLVYNHMMQTDGYAQEQMQLPYPGGRRPATPHSDRSLVHTNMEKPEDHLNLFAMPQHVPPPPQHVPSEPHWPLFASESTEPSTQVLQAPPNLPGSFNADGEGATAAAPAVSPELSVSRPPPGLEDEAANILSGAATNLCVEIPPVMQDMSTQTEGPACRSCGASFGCAGKCPWSRNQLLGFRDALLRTQMEPKEGSTLKAVRYGETTSSRKKNFGGA